jgi:hypothetical protein
MKMEHERQQREKENQKSAPRATDFGEGVGVMYKELLGHKINVGNSARMSASLLLHLSFGDDAYLHSGCFLLKCPGIFC